MQNFSFGGHCPHVPCKYVPARNLECDPDKTCVMGTLVVISMIPWKLKSLVVSSNVCVSQSYVVFHFQEICLLEGGVCWTKSSVPPFLYH